jgi:transposase
MLKGARKRIPRRSLEDTRRLVVHAIEKGMSVDQAAAIFECGRSTIFGWMKAHREQGPEALKVKKAPGATPKLTDRQLAQLRRTIIGKDPRQLQFEFALWTRDIVREVIKMEFGVEYTPQGVGLILRKLGLSPQRPLVRAYEQDPERVRRWKEVEYPRIRAHAVATGASIFWGDEASVRTDFHSGTTWAPIGQTPVVYGTGNRHSINMISAVSAQGKMHFSFMEGNTSSATFIDYLKKLLHDIPGKIYLIVDGHSAHTAKDTAKFIESTNGRLTLFFLPPYSPELNPDEWVWRNVKHDRVGRIAARTTDELRKGIENAISRLRQVPDIILGFFRDPDLSYIPAPIP